MEKKHRRKLSEVFKGKVVLDALTTQNTVEEPAIKYEVHPDWIRYWKKEFLNNIASVISPLETIWRRKWRNKSKRRIGCTGRPA